MFRQLCQLHWAVVFTWISTCAGSECSMQQSGNRVWIERSRELLSGLATRMSAVFCSDDPVIVQLWTEGTDSWTLVWEQQWQPKDTRKQQTMDIPISNQIEINTKHRIGVTTIGGIDEPISVRKMFNESLRQLMSSEEGEYCTLHEQCGFDQLLHPGTFLIQFCNNACPKLDVPDIPPTTKPAQCQVLDSKNKVKLEGRRPMSTGLVKAIKTQFCDTNSVKIQLWDLINRDDSTYILVWEKVVTPILAQGEEIIIPLVADEYIYILDTYRLGLQSVGLNPTISVRYEFYSGSGNIVTSQSDNTQTCSSQQFEGIPYPYQFLVDFCYDIACTTTIPEVVNHMETPCQSTDAIGSTGPSLFPSEGVSTAASMLHLGWLTTLSMTYVSSYVYT